jgi:hypothetical protein
MPLALDHIIGNVVSGRPDNGYLAHQSRTDWSMLLGALFLLIVRAGSWSLDTWIARRR